MEMHLKYAPLIPHMAQQHSKGKTELYFWAVAIVCEQECSLYCNKKAPLLRRQPQLTAKLF